MHLLLIVFALGVSWLLRMLGFPEKQSWPQRWQRSLFLFLVPPLMLLMTAVAIFSMGTQGQMLGLPAGEVSYWLSLGFLLWIFVSLGHLAYQGWRTQQRICSYQQHLIAGRKVRILETDFPYSAQIGFWQPELVVSRGMIETLDQDHLKAVFAHEEAHCQYRDTFWFFWLGWLRSVSFWLPNTEALWQELLFLREIRADWRATQEADALLLAESLLAIAEQTQQKSWQFSETFCAALNDSVSDNRLVDRIDALLTDSDCYDLNFCWSWTGICLALFPLLTLPLHHSLVG